MVFQFASLLPTLRVIDNVALPALVRGVTADEDAYRRATELLVRVGLGHRADAYPSELSGGEQRRAALARAIVNAPPIVLADEPTSDLDEETEAEILDALGEIHRRDGVALVVVTHDPEIARRADRILEIRNGSIVASWAGSSPLVRDARPSAGPWYRIRITPPRFRSPHRLPRRSRPPPASVQVSEPGCSRFPPGSSRRSSWPSRSIKELPSTSVISCTSGRQARAALEDAALLWLRADIDDVAYNGGASYTLTLSLENRSTASAVFVLSPSGARLRAGRADLAGNPDPVDRRPGRPSRADRGAADLPVCLRAEYQGVHGTVDRVHACAPYRLDARQPEQRTGRRPGGACGRLLHPSEAARRQ